MGAEGGQGRQAEAPCLRERDPWGRAAFQPPRGLETARPTPALPLPPAEPFPGSIENNFFEHSLIVW